MSRDKNESNPAAQMKPYQFAILRYVHDVSTHEFVNIGVVTWTPKTNKFAFKVNEHYRRLSKFFPGFDGGNYHALVRNLIGCFESVAIGLENHELFESEPKTIHELLPRILPFDNSCFQWSQVMSGISEDPEKRLEQLFGDFVGRNDPELPRERQDEGSIWRRVFERTSYHGLASKIERDVRIATARYFWDFKMGWKNGIPQVLEPVSLDLTDSDRIKEKSNSWVGRLQTLGKSNAFKMTAVVSAPRDLALLSAFEDSCAILGDSPSIRRVISEKELDDFLIEVKAEIK